MKRLLSILLLLQCTLLLHGQIFQIDGKKISMNKIYTGVPFLMISPDPVSSAMGDCGVATGNDVYSMHWNPAKYAVAGDAYESPLKSPGAGLRIGLLYDPWLRNLVSGINLGGIYLTKRINDASALSGSFRRLELGDITYSNTNGTILETLRPYEWAADIAWSQKITSHLYGAVAARFIYSNLTTGRIVAGAKIKPGTSAAADIALYYRNTLPLFSSADALAFGVNISNIGGKISYTDNLSQKYFIPTNLRIGTSYLVQLTEDTKLRLSLDFNKLLVPTPPDYAYDSMGNVLIDANEHPVIVSGMSSDVSVAHGMVQSFYDAPGGFREELREITIGFGAEMTVFNMVSLRGGYFTEDKTKGNRKFATCGLGLHYRFIGANISYLWADRLNPLKNTWRFGVSCAL